MPVEGCGGGGGASQVSAALQILTSVIHSVQHDKEGEGEKNSLSRDSRIHKSTVEQERTH